MDIGVSLKKIRMYKNYSQQYVAKYLNVSRSTYINWEKNKTNLTLQRCDKLCELYDIHITGLIEFHLKLLNNANNLN
ncbi:MAG: hypothetical protein JWP44_2066 [Mucilaginibacter sp.]|nr:hypothetical protein [Mucilaginibacter sp.]